jgi:ankyrin repeat protein
MEFDDIGEQLLDACLSDVEQAEWIITHHNDKNILNWQDLTCRNSILHVLVYQKLHLSVELLLNSGANPNLTNKVCFILISDLILFLEWRNSSALGLC